MTDTMTTPGRPAREAPNALDRMTALVREDLARRQKSPDDIDVVTEAAVAAVTAFERMAAAGHETALGDTTKTVQRIVLRVSGLGALEALLIPGAGVEDIFVKGPTVRYVAHGRISILNEPVSEAEALRIINQLLIESKSRVTLDGTHPVVDGVQVLGGRARVFCAVPPVSPDGLFAAIRLYTNRYASLASLEASGSITQAAAVFLSMLMRGRRSGLIAGETGAGKTTLLASVLGEAHDNHNVILVEESQELAFRPVFGARFQIGGPKAETLRDLVHLTMRVKPDIVAVGEVRGEEARELMRASRIGAGFWATIHANSAEDALEALVLTSLESPGVDERLVRRTFSRSLDVVVFCERDDPNMLDDGDAYRRQVTEIRALQPIMGNEAFASDPIFVREGGIGTDLVWTGKMPPTALCQRLERQLRRSGASLRDVLTGAVDPR